MNKKHFYAAVILLSFLTAGIQPAIAIDIPTDESVGSWNVQTRIYTLTQDVTEGLNIVGDNLTLDGNGFTVTPVGSDEGVDFYQKIDITVKNLNVNGGGAGISLRSSSGCTVTNNTISACNYGIFLAGSSNNEVTSNTVNSSTEAGIWLQEGVWVYSDDNTLTGNTTKNSVNGFGIYIQHSQNNTLTYNDTSNNRYGIKILSSAGGNTLENNTVSNNTGDAYTGHGIWIKNSATPAEPTSTLNYNQVFNNNGHGIKLDGSTDYDVTNNTISNNGGGIRISDADNNTIYNNNFIDNTFFQASVTGVGVSVFDLNGGGNYWSNWTEPDLVAPFGIVDVPYVFNGGQDNFPLAPTPEQALEELIDKVEGYNGDFGISNALDAKLQNALDALTAKNNGQRQDAVNKMEAFINAVEAQSGNKIPVEIADELIADAQYIIDLILAE